MRLVPATQSTPTVTALLTEYRDFRLLWAGTVVSFVGDWLTMVAVLTIVGEFSDASLWVSLVLIIKTLPIFLIVPFAGPLADRFDRRTILLVTDVLRSVLVLLMLGAYWLGSLPGVLIFLTIRTFIGGCFIPARSAAIPDLVRDDRYLPVAMALMGGTWSVSLAIGAGLGGVLTQVFGVTGALLIDAVTFLVSAAILWGLPKLPPRSETSSGDTGFASGLAYLKGKVYLPAVLLLKPALSLSGAMTVFLPLWSGGYYRRWEGPLYLGLLYTARGTGALIGSLGVRRIIGDSVPTLHRAIIVGYLIVACMEAAMALSPTYPSTWLFILVAMIGSGMVWPYAGTLGQLASEREMRGRLFAMEFGLTMAASSLAFLIVGGLLDWGVDPRSVLLGMAGLGLVPPTLWALVLRYAPDVPAAHGVPPAQR